MREINKHMAGLAGRNEMIFLTVVRNPVTWYRSAITQDINGYLPMLEEFSKSHGWEYTDLNSRVEVSLSYLLAEVVRTLRDAGGLDCYLKSLAENNDVPDFTNNRHLKTFLDLYLRPFTWFGKRYHSVLGVNLHDMKQCAPYVFKYVFDWGPAYVIRFEDLETSLELVMHDLGLDVKLVLGRDNIGSDKPYSELVSKLFTPGLVNELQQLGHGNYQRIFGYE